MNISPREETKSISISYQDDEGKDALNANASYGTRGIYINFNVVNQSFCTEHKEDIETAITAFIGRLNELLVESNLPIIHTAT